MKLVAVFFLVACGGSAPAPAPAPAAAPSKADEAKALDAEGQQLLADGKFAEAEKKFIAAYNKDVTSQYCYDICVSEEKQQKFQLAVNACKKVSLHGPTPELQQKADALIQQIQTEAKTANVELQ